MSSTEVFEYWLQVRDDANPALLKTSAAATSLGGAAYKAGGDLIKLSDVMGKLSTVGPTVANAFNNVSAGAKALQSRMAPAAAAISGVGAALGNSGGEMGKFVNAAAQGAAAFGAGGVWGLAIVGATLAIDEYTKVTKESEAALNVWRQQLTTVHPAMLATRETVKGLADEARRLGLEAANAGKTQYEVAIATAAAEKGVLESKLANIEATDRLRQAAVNEAQSLLESARLRGRGVAEAEERLETAKAIQSSVARNATEYRSQVNSIEDSVWKIADAWVTVEGRAKAARGVAAAGQRAAARDKLTEDADADANSRADREAAEQSRREAAELARQEAHNERIVDAQLARDQRLVDSANYANEVIEAGKKRHTDALLAIEASYSDRLLTLGESTLSTALSASQGYFDAKIKGEENAEQKAVASFLSATGQQLVASGTRALFEGGIISANPLTPGAGTPLMVAGGIAVAAGLAMGAGGSAMAHTAAGGVVGHAIPKDTSARTEKGPTSGSLGSGGTRTEAGASLTIIYGGLSGPTADQGLRTFTKAQGMAAGRAGLVSRRQRFR